MQSYAPASRVCAAGRVDEKVGREYRHVLERVQLRIYAPRGGHARVGNASYHHYLCVYRLASSLIESCAQAYRI